MKGKKLVIFLFALAAVCLFSFVGAKDKDEKPEDENARPSIANQLPGAR